MRAKSVHKILQKPVLKTGVHSNPLHGAPVPGLCLPVEIIFYIQFRHGRL